MVEIDPEEMQRRLMRVFAELAGLEQIGAETPMQEIRARAELAGTMFGRALAACLHEGEIGAGIAMDIRSWEQTGKAVFMDSVGRVCGPGGELRKMWSQQDGRRTGAQR